MEQAARASGIVWTRRAFISAAAILIAIHAALGLWCAQRNSVTFDEFAHLPAGAAYWRYGALSIYDLSPPLPRYWATMPLILRGDVVIPPVNTIASRQPSERHWAYGRAFMQANSGNYQNAFIAGRAMITLLSCVGAAITFAWTRTLAGDAAGLAACATYATCPDLVAHASVVGTDSPAAVALLAAAWLLARYVSRPSAARGTVAVIAIATLPMVKFSLLPVWPLVAIVLTALTFAGKLTRRQALLPIASLPAVGWAIVWISYAGQSGGQSIDEIGGNLSPLMAWLSVNELGWTTRLLPRPLVEGFNAQLIDADGKYQGYLFGRLYTGAAWGFYPTALACKWTCGFLILITLACLAAVRNRATIGLLPTALALGYAVAFSMLTRINIGSRYLLPMEPLLIVACAATIWRVGGAPLRRLACVAVGLACVEGLSAMPEPLAFYNVGARLTGLGGHAIIDADWGQSLITLREWMRANGVARIRLASMGQVDPAAYGIAFDEIDDRNADDKWTAWSDAFSSGERVFVARPGGGARWFVAPPDLTRRMRDGTSDARAGTFHLFRQPR